MFEIKTIATGSTGNCYLITDQDHHILIDPGIPIKKIRAATAGACNLAALDFVLLSHEHQDHAKAIPDLLRIGVKCAMSQGTRDALGHAHSSILILQSERPITLCGWKVLPFETQHDAAEPMGFLIESPSGKKILYATDTYYIKYIFAGITHWMVECNYSEELLQQNTALADAVKRRIRTSHFEIEHVKEFFRSQYLSETEKIYLIHLSEGNSDAAIFAAEIEKITGIPVDY